MNTNQIQLNGKVILEKDFKTAMRGYNQDEVDEFLDMAVIADTARPIPPCGSCRQVMSEFFDGSMNIYLSNIEQNIKAVKMKDLLPFSFHADDLG